MTYGTQFCESNSRLLRNLLFIIVLKKEARHLPLKSSPQPHTLFFTIHFHNFLPVTPTFSNLYLSSYFRNKYFVHLLPRSSVPQVPKLKLNLRLVM
jgi:hypothetical protein